MATQVVFKDGIGRGHDPITIPINDENADDPNAIANAVYGVARTHLMSSYPDVDVDLKQKAVLVFAGFHTVGEGIIEHTAGESHE
ncbi:MAG: hypothetical protein LKJ05_02660 [Bifidobacteriaceae bacterium]|jgi:hypothetical protein|nr:hypothetical protein [Bifidobacteriaceae bacterium]